MGDDEITIAKITGSNSGVVKPRIAKERECQSQRTKSRAEVFTPSWLCNQMNNFFDEEWFGRRDVFNVEEFQSWTAVQSQVRFPKTKGHGWHAYVESPRLEITCGEAPFVCSRYDTVSGNVLPINMRIGFLDRKMRVVTEKTTTRKQWAKWSLAALKATYGYEYQGDNLLIARINVFETFCEHYCYRWGAMPTSDELEQAAWIVSWNFWQMDGLTCAAPTNKIAAFAQSDLFDHEGSKFETMQQSLFDLLDDVFLNESTSELEAKEPQGTVPLCIMYDWQESKPLEFAKLKGSACPMRKKFYAVIGNPPYQAVPEMGSTRSLPIYDKFMDEAFKVSERVELITPARFLFNSGQTSAIWNEKMLNDPHLKVVMYEPDSSKVFSGVDIKGGVAVTYRDSNAEYDPIGLLSPLRCCDLLLPR
ncbi:Eco57I restriction-modification methylase domain-containing protein [Arabiibacter massiliensis]|uniref:Eco57I restriction-modification methylase domain-containing protein n=1 Tax=Arabiibacter massiliensis TaxID=1870985 RepID=UPI00155A2203|nr:Eco57I restriction-modification methylase domain-containing protein [Arabiibacter massiliensis]